MDTEVSFLNRTKTRLFKSVINMILKDDNAIIEDSETAGKYLLNKKIKGKFPPGKYKNNFLYE